MRKEVPVCDFCQREGVDSIATKCCCICSKEYCPKHAQNINVLVETSNQLGVRDGFEVCPDCHDLLAFDHWTRGEQASRASKFDRPIIKMVLPNAIDAVKESLQKIRHCIGPDNVEDWVRKRAKGQEE